MRNEEEQREFCNGYHLQHKKTAQLLNDSGNAESAAKT